MGLRRVTVRIKHHVNLFGEFIYNFLQDPIPDIEWWDLALLNEETKTYLGANNTGFVAEGEHDEN